jgi:hypothetical protein
VRWRLKRYQFTNSCRHVQQYWSSVEARRIASLRDTCSFTLGVLKDMSLDLASSCLDSQVGVPPVLVSCRVNAKDVVAVFASNRRLLYFKVYLVTNRLLDLNLSKVSSSREARKVMTEQRCRTYPNRTNRLSLMETDVHHVQITVGLFFRMPTSMHPLQPYYAI